MALSKSEKKQYCSGCHSNYYNGNNDVGITECWGLKSAKLVKRFRIGWWTPCDRIENFTEVKTLDCHKETGSFAFYDRIPAHLRK